MTYGYEEREFIQLHQTYMSRAFGDIEAMAHELEEKVSSDKYDTMVGTGLSGALVLPRLAATLGKRWAIVRKADGTHSSNPIEGEIGRKWLFVDDLICSGNTLIKVYSSVSDMCRKFDFPSEFVGMYGYQYRTFTNGQSLANIYNLSNRT